MNRYQALNILKRLGLDKLDTINVQSRVSHDPDTLSALAQDRHEVQSALDAFEKFDKADDLHIKYRVELGELHRAVTFLERYFEKRGDEPDRHAKIISELRDILLTDTAFIKFIDDVNERA